MTRFITYDSPIKPTSTWLAPIMLSSTAPVRSGTGQHRSRCPDDLIPSGAIRAAGAAKWRIDPVFNGWLPFNERVQIGWEAILLNLAKVESARNPVGLAYVIAWRTINKMRRDQFARRDQYVPKPDDTGEDTPFEEVAFMRAGSPNVWSRWRTEEFEQNLQACWDALARRLTAAMAELSSRERELLQLYYGTEDLILEEVAGKVGVPVSTVHRTIQKAITKLRVRLAPSQRELFLSRRKIVHGKNSRPLAHT